MQAKTTPRLLAQGVRVAIVSQFFAQAVVGEDPTSTR